MGYVILLLHSLSLPYNYFDDFINKFVCNYFESRFLRRSSFCLFTTFVVWPMLFSLIFTDV